jgi:hypothetical protein
MTAIIKHFTALFLVAFLFSCVSYKPVFYNNKKFKDVGSIVANQDFENCKIEAEEYLKEYKLKKASNEARRKAVAGGIFGGLWGLVFGNSTKSIIEGTLGGFIFGGLYGGFSSLADDKIKPDEIKKKYITRCLNQKNYEIIGWY